MGRSVFTLVAVVLIMSNAVPGASTAEAQDCVAGPDEVCVPVTWTNVPAPGTETAASCESLDVEHFLTCPQPHAQDTVSGSYTVHGAFTPPGAGWEMVDASGLSNQFQLTAHLEGFLYDPNLGNSHLPDGGAPMLSCSEGGDGLVQRPLQLVQQRGPAQLHFVSLPPAILVVLTWTAGGAARARSSSAARRSPATEGSRSSCTARCFTGIACADDPCVPAGVV